MAFKLSKALMTKLDDLATELDEAVQEMRVEYDDKSEKWQESDRGTSTGAWFEVIENLVDELRGVEAQPD